MISKDRIFVLTFSVIVGFSLVFSVALILEHFPKDKSMFSWDFILAIVFIFPKILFPISFAIVIMVLIRKVLDPDGSFINDYLIFEFREHRKFWGGVITITLLLVMIILAIILIISFFLEDQEIFIQNLKEYLVYLWGSFMIFVIGIAIWCQAQMMKLPKLNSALAEKIKPKQIVMTPEAAIRDAFVFFEDRLKKKVGLEEYGRPLIGKAFGGKLPFLICPKKYEQERLFSLILAVYDFYRNPLAHNDLKFDQQMVMAILTLLDEFIKIIDESVPSQKLENQETTVKE